MQQFVDLEDGTLFLYEVGGSKYVYRKITDNTDNTGAVLYGSAQHIAHWDGKPDGQFVFQEAKTSERFNPYATVQPVEVMFVSQNPALPNEGGR